MLQKIKQFTTAQWLALAGTALMVLIVYNIILAFTRAGEIKTTIQVVPKFSKISIDGKAISSKTVYLGPGDHTFSASTDGWKTDTQKINISKDDHRVNLLPAPESKEAKSWLENNPEAEKEREGLSGETLDRQNQNALSQNPVLAFLPYSQESPPFNIDYGPSKDQQGGIFLIVSESSPNGRQAALDWIRQHGQDPTDLDITFTDFVNPLSAGRANAD